MTTYILIAVVMLFIAAPVFALLPSPRQKEQMAMRKKAMALGVGVELTTIEDPDPDPDKYRTSTGKPLPRVKKVTAYRLQRKRPHHWRAAPMLSWSLARAIGDGSDLPPPWQWQDTRLDQFNPEFLEFLKDSLKTLPGDVVLVEEKGWVVSVYWNEKGAAQARIEKSFETGIDRSTVVVEFLKACTSLSPHHPPTDDDVLDTFDPDEA